MVAELLPEGPFFLEQRRLPGFPKTNPDGLRLPGRPSSCWSSQNAEMMYVHRYSKPKAVHVSQTRRDTGRPDKNGTGKATRMGY